MNPPIFDRTAENMEAVRGGYAYVKQRMESTRNAHAVHVEGTRRMYLCQCMPQIRGVDGHCKFKAGRSKDSRFGDAFRYGRRAR